MADKDSKQAEERTEKFVTAVKAIAFILLSGWSSLQLWSAAVRGEVHTGSHKQSGRYVRLEDDLTKFAFATGFHGFMVGLGVVVLAMWWRSRDR
jgi:hypothetical protein